MLFHGKNSILFFVVSVNILFMDTVTNLIYGIFIEEFGGCFFYSSQLFASKIQCRLLTLNMHEAIWSSTCPSETMYCAAVLKFPSLAGEDVCLPCMPLFLLAAAHLPFLRLLWLLGAREPHVHPRQDHWPHTG